MLIPADILLVSATAFEVSGARIPGRVMPLVTGIGLASAAARLSACLAVHRPKLVVHAGIAGSFRDDLPAGSLCEIETDAYGDFGAWAPAGYTGSDAGAALPFLQDMDAIIPFDPTIYRNPSPKTSLPKVRGITVQTVSGTDMSIRQIRRQHNPDIETMEGAVVLQLCLETGIPFCGIRAISNPVTIRDRSRWDIGLATQRLGDFLTEFLPHL